MNKLLRQEFMRLHSQPLLETLLKRWQTQYPNIVFPPLPPKGPLDLTRILESKYFFH
jgi:DNA-directed RNA polymerase